MTHLKTDDGTWITRNGAAEPSEHLIEITEVFVDGSVFREMQYAKLDTDCADNGISRYSLK
jgi:hypothetical protein